MQEGECTAALNHRHTKCITVISRSRQRGIAIRAVIDSFALVVAVVVVVVVVVEVEEVGCVRSSCVLY